MKPSARPSLSSIQPPARKPELVSTITHGEPGPPKHAFHEAWNGTAMVGEANDDMLVPEVPIEQLAWNVPWADASAQAREHRVGDLVLAGYSIVNARQLGPTTEVCPAAEKPRYADTTRADRLRMRGVRAGDLDVSRDFRPTQVVRDEHGIPRYINLGAEEQELRRRTADLVLAGHSIDEARRLAPTTITQPSDCEALIEVPLTPAETMLSKKRMLESYMRSMTLEQAVARMLKDDRYRQDSIDRKVANDRTRSPKSARAYAESRQELVDALMYRTMERSRRLDEAGVDESSFVSIRPRARQ